MARYNNKFFRTRDEAFAFQKENGGAVYSNMPRSRTKGDFLAEVVVAYDARHEIVDVKETPWCVAWNETEDVC